MATPITTSFDSDLPPPCIKPVDVSTWVEVSPMPLMWLTYLYYNLYKVKGVATVSERGKYSQESWSSSATYTPEPENALVEISDVSASTRYQTTPPEPESLENLIYPHDRICESYDARYFACDEENCYYAAELYLKTSWDILAMYDGDPEAGAPLLGYGINSLELPEFLVSAYAGEDGGDGYLGSRKLLLSGVPYDTDDFSLEATRWWNTLTISPRINPSPVRGGGGSLNEYTPLSLSQVEVAGFPFVLLEYASTGSIASSQQQAAYIYETEIGDFEFFYYPEKTYPAP